jgi:carnitine 3-dehydrogenase
MPKESYVRPEEIRSVAVIGAGSVGAGWASLFLARGLTVVAHDPGPSAEATARSFIVNAWPSLVELGVAHEASAPLERLIFVSTAAEAARAADLVQENIPEKGSPRFQCNK